jgi:hypothetical protein
MTNLTSCLGANDFVPPPPQAALQPMAACSSLALGEIIHWLENNLEPAAKVSFAGLA